MELLVAEEDTLFNGRTTSTVPKPVSGPTITVRANICRALTGYEKVFEIKIIFKKFRAESSVNAQCHSLQSLAFHLKSKKLHN
jgi:hypothetical protein